MAVNKPIPRAQPEGEVCLRCALVRDSSSHFVYTSDLIESTCGGANI